jgi:hypothetical protein
MPMSSYDYNATYGELPVHDQGKAGNCWQYAHALGLVAAGKMNGVDVPWPDGEHPAFLWAGDRFKGTLADAEHTFVPEGSVDLKLPELVRSFLDAAGFAHLAVAQPGSLNACMNKTDLPVIAPAADDVEQGGHSVLVVGYTDDGLLIQNSWGLRFGYQGRAVLSWAWLERFGYDLERAHYDDYPTLGATKSPVGLATDYDKEPMMLLARRAENAPVWCFMGGVRSFIAKSQVLAPQGMSMDDVKIIPGTHLLWTATTPIGPLPNGKDW